MNPRTSTFDRILTILLALVLLLGGVWLAAWALERLPAGWWSPTRFTVGLGEAVTGTAWWPWALLLGGVLVALIGLLWLGSHFRANGVGALALPGADRTGRLIMDASALASGAANALTRHPGVSSASGRLVEEKKRVVLALTVTVSPQADLRAVVRACDDVAAHVLSSSGRQDLACRVRVKVASRARSAPRVR
jgi:hypothetical protein